MARRFEITESIYIRGVAPEQIWQLIRPAEAGLFHPMCIDAHSEPDTEPGVGEVQTFTYQLAGEREVVRARVLAEKAPYFAEFEVVDSDPSCGGTFRLKRRRGGTSLVYTIWFRGHLGTYTVPVDEHREYAIQFLTWVRQSFESAAE